MCTSIHNVQKGSYSEKLAVSWEAKGTQARMEGGTVNAFRNKNPGADKKSCKV